VGHDVKDAFAIWITGLPASGKSAVARLVRTDLAARRIDVAVLESDALREALHEDSDYNPAARDRFYRYLAYAGVLLIRHGIPVIFDATANRRKYREQARQQIRQFLEVYINCPLAICIARDPKGIYRRAQEGEAGTVPGLQDVYEPPEQPDLVINSEQEQPGLAAQRIVRKLIEKGYVNIEDRAPLRGG
jgi:adenylylsulfate kinase